MTENPANTPKLPTAAQIRRAMEIYFRHAFPAGPSERLMRFLPDEADSAADWLMTDVAERDCHSGDPVASYALRVGNCQYPNMKVRISLPPNGCEYLFCVDAHDDFLQAPKGSPDYAALEAMKAFNASVAQETVRDWSGAGLPTELNYMRRKIEEARNRKEM